MGGGMEKARTCCRIVVAAVLVVALYLSWLGCSIAAANADRITELERGGRRGFMFSPATRRGGSRDSHR